MLRTQRVASSRGSRRSALLISSSETHPSESKSSSDARSAAGSIGARFASHAANEMISARKYTGDIEGEDAYLYVRNDCSVWDGLTIFLPNICPTRAVRGVFIQATYPVNQGPGLGGAGMRSARGFVARAARG